MTAHRTAAILAGCLLGMLLLATAPALATTPSLGTPPILGITPAFKIYIEESGVYRLDFEALPETGLPEVPRSLPSAGLGLTCGGEDVPIRIVDGGDGIFGPGDHLEFVGEHLRGEVSYYNEHSRYNVYVLSSGPSVEQAGPARLVQFPQGKKRSRHSLFERLQHLEEDLLFVRLPNSGQESDELWYWEKLVMNAALPTVRQVDLGDLGKGPATVRVHLRGWSRPAREFALKIADHRVDLVWNGKPLTTASWDGTEPYLLEARLPARRLVRGENVLELRVPRRRLDPEADEFIDVVLLNWVEISYPHGGRLGGGQTHLRATAAGSLVSGSDIAPVAYDPRGWWIPATRKRGKWVLEVPDGESSLFVAPAGSLKTPAAVVLDRPSRLREADNRADYIMVAHHTLLDPVTPLAALHRSRGLAVQVVDLEDVYDEFNHGIPHPRAIRDFLRLAHETWRPPAPRFVLLVGDASWDSRNTMVQDENYADWTYRAQDLADFGKNLSSPYLEDAESNSRGLVPTWSYSTHEGHAASDNFFVAVSGADGDNLPAMAIGRLPVVRPEEVAQIVEKTVRYVTRPPNGPWRSNTLFITNESALFQLRSDRLASQLSTAGFTADKIYPESGEISNEHHTAHLIEAFDEGQLLVHFLGHGGRYIWRTGPSSLGKERDLFTLDHLDQLAPGGRLPVVLSMTCYSAPFDHPSADSIGEKLLRLEDRGAVAILAASWRNNPSQAWSKALLEELTRPGATVGEAVMAAKHRIGKPMFVATYNLLGDPAAPVALPFGLPDTLPVDKLTLGHDAEDDVATEPVAVVPVAMEPVAVAQSTAPLAEPVSSSTKPYSNAVKWSTASELDNFGYDVYRGEHPDGPFVRLTEEPVPGAVTSDEIQRYRFVDDMIDPTKTYYYYVESISLSGQRERFTPVGKVQAKIPTDDKDG